MGKKIGPFRYIIDEPAEVDAFNTHSPVASAITTAISENPAIKVIGLLGRWGSGKSTIIREVASSLARNDPKHLTFSYDAWLHQHDPLRRSFFESLVNYFVELKLIDEKKWRRKSQELSGELEIVDRVETPIITFQAKLFAILALIFTFGLSLLDGSLLADGFGANPKAEEVWTLRSSFFMIFGAPIAWIIYVLIERARGEKASILPDLIVNTSIERQHTEITKPLDATSLEFGNAFRELMKEVQSDGYKITIVVDNIDRVNEVEALEIWASIRSFFLSSQGDNSASSEVFHPTVLLPVDDRALEKVFSIGDDSKSGKRLARSFVNKTFDATFVVPHQVLSNWKMYLNDRMKFALGSSYSEKRYFVTRQFVERWFKLSDLDITPREINQIVNNIVSLLLQWGDHDIQFETIAYFTINRDRISADIAKEIKRTDHPLERVSNDWARQLAALHFGVGVEDAAQVLMTDPIRDAMLENDESMVAPYREVVGFGDIFEEVSRDLPTEEGETAPSLNTICSAVNLMRDAKDEGPWVSSAKRNLLAAAASADAPEKLTEHIVYGLTSIFEDAPDEDALALVKLSERIVDKTISKEEVRSEEIEWAAAIGQEALALAKNSVVRLPIYDLTSDAKTFCTRILAMKSKPDVQARTRTSAAIDTVKAEVIRLIQTEEEVAKVPHLLALLTGDNREVILRSQKLEMAEIYNALENAVRSSAPETAIFVNAFKALSQAGDGLDDRAQILQRLASDNSLVGKLPGIGKLDDQDVNAGTIAFLIHGQHAVDPLVGPSWQRYFRNRPGQATKINRVIDRFFEAELPVDILLKSYETSYKNLDLVRELMNDRIRRKSLGRLNSKSVISNFSKYSKMASGYLRDDFAQKLSEYERFWPNIKSLAWSNELFEAASLLIKEGGDVASRIKAELRAKIAKTSKLEWLAAVQSGAEPFRTATELLDQKDLGQGVNSHLFEALMEIAEGKGGIDAKGKVRFFALTQVVSRPAKKRILVAIRDNILVVSNREKVAFVKEGGSELLTLGEFDKNPEKVVQDLIVPLINSKIGRRLLLERAPEFKNIVKRASSGARSSLHSAVQKAENGGREGDTHWGEVVRRSWSLG